jgi:two-component system, cell cycle response regulator
MRDASIQRSPYPILIVEDNLLMRKILEGYLRDMGHPVTAVENGRQALESLNSNHVPIVITDLVMPEMDGVELCRAIREQTSDKYTYIIMLSSYDSKEGMIRGLDAGADEYLIKPINHTELLVRLKTADRILSLESSLKQSYEEIKALSVRDPLTGMFNRGYLDERLLQEVKRSFRFERPLSVIMLDFDHFKQINDNFGHAAGDQVLRDCSSLLLRTLRMEIDWIARYGGEEFAVVLPETFLSGAMIAAERLRITLAAHSIFIAETELRITASFGVAGFVPASQKEDLSVVDTLIACADECLYRAKREGRNRVISTRI